MKKNACFYMANLGSEFTRLIRAREFHDEEGIEASADRALQITEIILALPDMFGRGAEVEMLSDIIKNIRAGQSGIQISNEHANSYFMPFAVRVLSSI